VRQAIVPVRMGLRPMKGDENLAEVQFSRTSIDALTGGRVADRVGGKGEAFDRAGGLSVAFSALAICAHEPLLLTVADTRVCSAETLSS
jgi:hypothetical protein